MRESLVTDHYLSFFVQGNVWWALPRVIYGTLGITAGLLSILLPETLGVRMCETIEEAETDQKHAVQHVVETEPVLQEKQQEEEEVM